ncbi:PAS domain S-box protein [Noviherbaspirillum pedocola]|uniref:histidine kinase n=1 Tax=Noviherbaspirillum pedocola TaxID=2801341 RepID=A0A934W4M4_9BURK|nr:PAS domain S-box protein [Noviherbaspirillum pedocola]MBK4734037.1 PAS domain S-box protein [Noviherbaspirillum pedocola]
MLWKGCSTLRQWFALLVLACVLPACAVTLLLVISSYQRERERFEQITTQTAHALMLAVNHDLYGIQNSLQALATSTQLASGHMREFDAQTRDALRAWPGARISLANAHGERLIDTDFPYGRKPDDAMPAAQPEAVFAGAVTISSLQQPPQARRMQFTVTVPVHLGGAVAYALSMTLPAQRIDSILKQQQLPAGWPAAVIDGEGIILARSMQAENFVGGLATPELLRRMRHLDEGSLATSTLEGIAALIAYSRGPGSPWTVAIGAPRTALTAALWRSIAWTVLGSVLLLACCLMLVRVVAEHITRSIRALAAPAMALGYGEAFSLPPLPLHEAENVAGALRKAAQLLQQRTEQRDSAERRKAELIEVQSRLEASEALLRAIFEEAPDGLLLVAPDGRILRANEQASMLFGRSRADLVGMAVEELVPREARERHCQLCAGYFDAPTRRSMGSGRQLHAQRADGSAFPVDIMLSPLRAAQGRLVIVTIRDASERLRNESALRDSESRFRSMLEYAPIGMSVVSPEGRFLIVNRALCELLGFDADELLQKNIRDITHPDDLAHDLALSRQMMEGSSHASQLEKRYIRKDGASVHVLLTRSLLCDDAGKPLYFIAQIEDISESRRARERLTALNRRLALATQAGGIAVWELDLQGGAIWWDERMFALYGASDGDDPHAVWESRVLPQDRERVAREFDEARTGLVAVSTEFTIRWPDGRQRILRADAMPTRDDAGRPLTMTGINWDITETRQREAALSAALQEKDTLLRELYHRVKNNLQVISSLFSLQLRTLPDGEARLALQESADRVRAMALVHEKLYQSKNLSSIALDDYIGDLCHQLGNAAGAAERGIALEASAQPVEVGLQVAVPLGLVLNELLANSLRHGFPEGRRGHIAVHLACGADHALSLTVTDDGVGLPPGMNIATSRTLGLKLVQALASQLDGSFSLESRDGTVARLQFRLVGEKRQDAASRLAA